MITALSIILHAAAVLIAATCGRVMGDMAYRPSRETRNNLNAGLYLTAFFFVTAVVAQVWS